MKDWKTFVNDLASKMGFEDYRADIDAEHGHGALYLHDNPTLVKENLAPIVESINHILDTRHFPYFAIFDLSYS